jgi:lysozyme
MNIDLLKKQLIRHEGLKTKTYKDSLGYPTGGIGHLLVGNEKTQYPVGTSIPQEVIDKWFDHDVNTAIQATKNIVTEEFFNSIDDVRQRVLIDLAFNLGESKLRTFKNTLAYFAKKDWKNAANNLRQSLWYGQVKSRGVELTTALETGKFSWE